MNVTSVTKTVALLIVCAVGAPAQDREERVSQSYEVGSTGELSLANISGTIVVETTDGTEIHIEAVKRVERGGDANLLDRVRIEMTHHDDRVRVSTRHAEGRRGNHGSVSVDYTVKVPAGTEVEVASVSGSIRVQGVRGETMLRNVSGNVEAIDAHGLTEAKSVSGNVTVQGARSGDDLEVKSVSGDVFLRDIEADDLDAGSVSGYIEMEQVKCEQGEFDSVSGDIKYDGALMAGGNYEFKSHSGDIVLTVGDDVGFELEARTFSGKITSDFEMNVTERSRKGNKLNAVIGNGSAVVETTTFSGDVELRRR